MDTSSLIHLKTDESKKEYVARFDSWQDFLDFGCHALKTCKGDLSTSKCYCKGKTHQRDCFTQTFSIEEAYKLATDGWAEGTEKVARISLEEFTKVSEKIERAYYLYDVEGIDFDVARVLEGEPEVWTREEVRVTDGPGRRIFHVVFQCCVSSAVDAKTIIARGAACCALIQALEMSGHGVDLTLADSISSRNSYQSHQSHSDMYIKLKSADQPIDLARAAFSLAHPSTLRRLAFAVQERLPFPDTYSVGLVYGYPPFDAPKSEQGDIYFSGASILERDWNNPEVVEAWILDTLKKQGIVIRED